MAIKMIAVDMDGTFLDDYSSYNQERFYRIYQILKDREIRFVVARNPQPKTSTMFSRDSKRTYLYCRKWRIYHGSRRRTFFCPSFT